MRGRVLGVVALLSSSLASPSHAAGSTEAPPCLAWNSDESLAQNVKTIALTRAIRLDVPPVGTASWITEIRLFSGLVQAQSRLALHTHDAAKNAPGELLAETRFTLKASLGWQGGLLSKPVQVEPATTYWVVWDAPQGAQMPWDAPKGYLGQAHRISTDGGQTWDPQVFQSNASHFKVAWYGPCACAAKLWTLGTGCGSQPFALLPEACPQAGGALALRVEGGPPAVPALLLAGAGATALPVGGGCFLHVLPAGSVAVPLQLDVTGHAAIAGPLPAAAAGSTLVLQVFGLEPGPGLAATPGLLLALP